MDSVSSGTPPLDADEELAAAYRELRAAIDRREVEHEKELKTRAVFFRAVSVVFLGILVGAFALMMTFDVDVFKAQFANRVSEQGPGVARNAREALDRLAPIYQAEVTRTFPSFTRALTETATREAGNLVDTIAPLAHGDPTNYTGEADGELAKLLLSRFGKELHHDFGEARALASALRAQQILSARTVLDNEAAGPFATLHDIELSLRGLGPPDREIMTKGDTIDVLGNAALEVVKARLVSGEGFGLNDKGEKKTGGK